MLSEKSAKRVPEQKAEAVGFRNRYDDGTAAGPEVRPEPGTKRTNSARSMPCGRRRAGARRKATFS